MQTVLVVDDEASMRSIVCDVLEAAGYRVLEAANGAAALARAATAEAPVDLVLTDLAMPGMDGLTLVRHLRAAHPDLRVLIMSGLPEPDQAGVARETFLQKPFTSDALEQAVREALAVPAR